MSRMLETLGRWPLLFGAVVCISGALWLAENAGDTTAVVAVLLSLGSVLLGAWVHNLATRDTPKNGDTPRN